MAIEFLIGPAGSGKTHTCLGQVRQVLANSPDGPPLLWIAPKQATFQLERQVLGSEVRGFTRLQILPFDRLARWILGELGEPVRDTLSEEGRVMVLRSLLLRLEPELQAFRTSARAAGFATQLSQVLRELQRIGAGPEQLRRIELPESRGASLPGKIRDIATLLEAYRDWLEEHHLRDGDDLLEIAARALVRNRKQGRPTPRFEGLWLDGFAEMTAPELDLLVAALPDCTDATLAFCMDQVPGSGSTHGIGGGPGSMELTSLWGVTASTYLRCLDRVQSLGLASRTRSVAPEGSPGFIPPRFRHSPTLAHLATSWARPGPSRHATIGDDAPLSTSRPSAGPGCGVNLVECADPEAEALLAVRVIQRHVREGGGRYRDISVIVRRMDGYGHVLQRAFRRHGIPFFADHREPMGHHPIAELSRSALRMGISGWSHDEWLAALKTGLVSDNPVLVDNLENDALRHGLHGEEWMRPEEYQRQAELSDDAVRCLEKPIAAFRAFRTALGDPAAVNGRALSEALRSLWHRLDVASTLARWQAEANDLPPLFRAIHHTAWEQIHSWSDNFALAFTDTTLPMRDWLAIAESGLSRLTLGVIPPALDQVLIGAVDRARQPEVALTLVLGLNEGEFPATPASPALLNRAERQTLAEGGLDLGWGPLQQAARENYYAYIACTRPGRSLCVSWSRRNLEGKGLIRSSAAERVLTLLGWETQQAAMDGDVTQFDGRLKSFSGNPRPDEAGSLSELFECPGWHRSLPDSLAADSPAPRAALDLARIRSQLRPAPGEAARRLDMAAVEKLHQERRLVSSVSALENFAECPFRHFARHQLRLGEREELEADAAGTGTLLHSILRHFHDETMAANQRWRDHTPRSAGQRIRELGAILLATPEHHALRQDAIARWESTKDIDQLAIAVGQMVAWLSTCQFDPTIAELTFGEGRQCRVPAWQIPLGDRRTLEIRGSIDRIDVRKSGDGGMLVAVFDYKSSAKSPNRARMEHGLELQLLAYLAFATASEEVGRLLDPTATAGAIARPAGAFYVPLAPKLNAAARGDDTAQLERKRLESLSHLGRGDRDLIEHFDSSPGYGARGWAHSRQFRPSHFVPAPDFENLLGNVVEALKGHGRAILEGVVGILPARYGAGNTACDYCAYRALCRFEPLDGAYRTVTSKPTGPR